MSVTHRRFAEETLVLSVEVRGVVVPYAVTGSHRIQALSENEAASLLEPDLLLKLQGAHRGDCLELGIRGNSHMIMQDRNSLQIADLILQWIGRSTQSGSAEGR